MTVFFGFGVFSTNAALRFARARRGWSIVPQGDFDDLPLNAARRNDSYNRLGYLKSQEFVYAMARWRAPDASTPGDPSPGGLARASVADAAIARQTRFWPASTR